MALTAYTLSDTAHDAAGAVLAGAKVRIQLTDTKGRPAADFFAGSGSQQPVVVETESDSNGAWSADLPSNLDGNQDLRYRVTITHPTTGAGLTDELIQMPRAASTLAELVDASSVTPDPETAAALERAFAGRYAAEDEDVEVVDTDGNGTGDFSALHGASKSDKHKQTSERWASLTGSTVTDVESGVDSGEYGAKEYAQGDETAHGGSAKAWAQDASSPDGTTSKSAKTWAGEAETSANDAAASTQRVDLLGALEYAIDQAGQAARALPALEGQAEDLYTALSGLEQALDLAGQVARQVNGGRVSLRGGSLADPALRIGTAKIYSSATDTLSVGIGDSEILRVTSAGLTIYGNLTEA